MNGHGESDRVIVPGKPPNNEEKAGKVPVDESAEEVEGRTLAKENLRQQTTHRTRGRKRVHSVLARVRRAAEGSAWGVSSSTAGTHHSGSTTPIPTTGSASESEAGAQCGSPARWDLCGGRPERAVPTATACTSSTSWNVRRDACTTKGPSSVNCGAGVPPAGRVGEKSETRNPK